MGNGNPAIPVQPAPFRHRLTNLESALSRGRPVKIVAIGSSTTAGEGGIPPYPGRLEAALRAKYGERISVLNKGIGGQEAPSELARLQTDVIDEAPALVIWQVGTNAVWNGDSLEVTAAAIRYGLQRLNQGPMDVILLDLQYVPAVITPNRIDAANMMVKLIAEAAANADPPVNVFQRFAMMRDWHVVEQISFDRMLDPTDPARLHHSDWSTERLAYAVCKAIVDVLPAPRA
jgi:lysophospholipase L1-like esterase